MKPGKRFVRLEHCPLMCARSGTSLDCKSLRGWFESICALVSHSSNRRGQGIPNPQIRVQVLYETYGYVAKWFCSGLLNRKTQVRILSCPLRPRRLTERPGGYEPPCARPTRAGDTVTVAERLCSGLWIRHTRVQIPSVTFFPSMQNCVKQRAVHRPESG